MNKLKKLSALVLLIILLTLLITQIAFAASSNWTGYVGGIKVTATKNLYLGGNSWSTYLYSAAVSNISVIGYTYWTVAEYCPATQTYAYYKHYSGDFNTNDDGYNTSAVILYRGCNGTSQHKSLGNHDFANAGQHIYPYVSISLFR